MVPSKLEFLSTIMSSNARKVLIVDDEPDITGILSKGLIKLGFQVDTFNDSMTALSQFKPNYYDAIILDIRMPNLSGFELAKRIWAKASDARICFLSAFEIHENEARKVFQSFKTHYFLKKPITPSELAKHIETLLLKVSQL